MNFCANCPLIQYEIENRLKLYGYEDIKNNPQEKQEILDEIIISCWCEKFGTKICWTNINSCDYEYISQNKKKSQHNNKKKLSKRDRRNKYKNHLKFLNNNLNHYLSPSIALDKNREWVNLFQNDEIKDVSYYKRLYRGQRSKYLKKISHKKVRKYKGELSQKGNSSNKLFDFWWEYD